MKNKNSKHTIFAVYYHRRAGFARAGLPIVCFSVPAELLWFHLVHESNAGWLMQGREFILISKQLINKIQYKRIFVFQYWNFNIAFSQKFQFLQNPRLYSFRSNFHFTNAGSICLDAIFNYCKCCKYLLGCDIEFLQMP